MFARRSTRGLALAVVAALCAAAVLVYRVRPPRPRLPAKAPVAPAKPLAGGVRTPALPAVPGPRFAGANVVVITVDTLRRDHLAPYGAAFDTPAASRLAREGVVFERAVSHVPLTLPSHSSIFTALYPPHHGVRDNAGFALGKDVTTLAERLLARGYQTAAVVGSYVLAARWGLAKGHETYDDSFDYSDIERRALTEVERPAGQVVDHALEWLRTRRRGDRPFYLWIHLYDPHDPYTPPDEYRRRAPTAYAGEVMYADAQVARLLDALDAMSLRRNDRDPLPRRPRRVAGRARRGGARHLPLRRHARRADDPRAAFRRRRPREPAPGGPARARPGAAGRRRPDGARPRRPAGARGPRRRQPAAAGRARGRRGAVGHGGRGRGGRARRPGLLRRDLVSALPPRLERARPRGDGPLELDPGAAARALRPPERPEGARKRPRPAPERGGDTRRPARGHGPADPRRPAEAREDRPGGARAPAGARLRRRGLRRQSRRAALRPPARSQGPDPVAARPAGRAGAAGRGAGWTRPRASSKSWRARSPTTRRCRSRSRRSSSA